MFRRRCLALRSSLVALMLIAPLAGLTTQQVSAALPRTDEPVAPMTLTAFTVTPASASVAGFGSVDVAFAATLDLQGSTVANCDESMGGYPDRYTGSLWVSLSRIDRPMYAAVPLTTSTPGRSATSGTWTGIWKVASTRGGRWRVTQVAGCLSGTPLHGAPLFENTRRDITSVDPSSLGLPSEVVVTAVRAPRITDRVLARTWPAAPILQVMVTSGGRPVPGRKVLFMAELGCTWSTGALAPTNSGGIASVPITGDAVTCWMVTTPPAESARIDQQTAWVAGGGPVTRRWMFSSLAVTRPVAAVRGRALRVNGAVTPTSSTLADRYEEKGPQIALLQRLTGRTWRTIAVASVRSTGRFTLLTVPTATGRMLLRVSVSGYLGRAGAPWATFGPNRTAPWAVTIRSS